MDQPKSKKLQPVIKTPQELVHIKHKITLRQYKYWVLMLKVYRETYESGTLSDNAGFHRLSVSNLTDLLGYEPVRAELRADLESLRKEPIEYNVLEKDGKQTLRGAGFISEWEVSSNWIGFKLPSFLSEVVERLDLKSSMFQMLNWNVFNSLSGKYEAFLYKLCKDYVGVLRTPYMTLLEYRAYMGINDDEYQDFKRLSQWVIIAPVKKINKNELSDIKLEVVLRKENRRVVGLHFIVTPKNQSVMDFGDDPAFRFAKVAIALPQQKKYLKAYPPDLIELSIQRANVYAEELEKKGEVVDMGAIYRTAITSEWGKEFASKLKRDKELQEEQNKAKEKTNANAAKVKKQKAESAAEGKANRELAMSRYLAETDEVKDEIWKRFMSEVGNTTPAAKTKKLESPTVRKMFEAWLSKL